MKAFDAYQMYLAIKMHFQGNYDYHKYNGKINASQDKFQTRNDKYFFQKLAKLYKEEELEMLLVSNFIRSGNVWVGKLFEDEARNNYLETRGRHERIKYVFTEDVGQLKLYLDVANKPFAELFAVRNGQHPLLLQMLLKHKITLESFIIIAETMQMFDKWNTEIQDTVVWPDIYKKCMKYRPFLTVVDINKQVFKKILIEKFLDN